MATTWDADNVETSRISPRESAGVTASTKPAASRARRRLAPGREIPFGLQISPALLVLAPGCPIRVGVD